MYSYNDRVAPEDRWRIAAYVKTLQLSQGIEVASLTPEERQKVEAARRAETQAATQPSRESLPKGARP